MLDRSRDAPLNRRVSYRPDPPRPRQAMNARFNYPFWNTIALAPGGPEPLYDQIAGQIRALVVDGAIPRGMHLPLRRASLQTSSASPARPSCSPITA